MRVLFHESGLIIVPPPGEQIRLDQQEAVYLGEALAEGCERLGRHHREARP